MQCVHDKASLRLSVIPLYGFSSSALLFSNYSTTMWFYFFSFDIGWLAEKWDGRVNWQVGVLTSDVVK